jgi:hypothetical protein
MCLIHDLAT